MVITLNASSLDNIVFPQKYVRDIQHMLSENRDKNYFNKKYRTFRSNKILWSFDDAVNSSQKLHHWALRISPVFTFYNIYFTITAYAVHDDEKSGTCITCAH